MPYSLGDGIPVLGKWVSDRRLANDFETVKDSVDANFSIRTRNGNTNVSSNQELTIILGAARIGARLWMDAGGNRARYEQLRDDYFNDMNEAIAAAAIILSPNLIAYIQSLKNNIERGAGLASGLGANSLTARNIQMVDNGLVTKVINGDYLYNTSNQLRGPGQPGLRAVGYQQAQEESQNQNRGQSRGRRG
jgi:hypothetical protein